jgi:hypothetical protein
MRTARRERPFDKKPVHLPGEAVCRQPMRPNRFAFVSFAPFAVAPNCGF